GGTAAAVAPTSIVGAGTALKRRTGLPSPAIHEIGQIKGNLRHGGNDEENADEEENEGRDVADDLGYPDMRDARENVEIQTDRRRQHRQFHVDHHNDREMDRVDAERLEQRQEQRQRDQHE